MDKQICFSFQNVLERENIIFVYIYQEYITWKKRHEPSKSGAHRKKRMNKWLAEQLGKAPATVSEWFTNSAQPSLENLIKIAKYLEVNISKLIRNE